MEEYSEPKPGDLCLMCKKPFDFSNGFPECHEDHSEIMAELEEYLKTCITQEAWMKFLRETNEKYG